MSNDGSVTHWINQLQLGDGVAAQHLWQRYFHRLVSLARKKLSDVPRGVADEEDVALSAFDSFCRRAEQGRFPELSDRDGLWKLLVVITARKAGHLRREQMAVKRGGGAQADDGEDAQLLREILSREPDPAVAAVAAEEHRRLMEALGDDLLRQVALLRMQGDSVEQIATQIGTCERSVKRKLRLIREIWERELLA